MGVKTLADGNTKVTLLAAAPADKNAITLSELTAVGAKEIACSILSSDFDYGPTGSDTVNEKPLCATGNGQAPGLSNFAGGMTVFRYWDTTTGQADGTDDFLWTAVQNKGVELHLVVRDTHKKATEAWAGDDEYRYFRVITDDPQRGERTGFIKYRVTLMHQDAALDKKVVDDTSSSSSSSSA